MEVVIQSTADEATAIAARMIARCVRQKPASVLGLATGSTPLKLYKALIEMHRQGLDFSRVTTFNLDEYVGLGPDHYASYNRFMEENFFAHVNIPRSNIHIPDGLASDIPAHCAAYERRIRDAGGVDIQILGIGTDGHLGFNEPTSSLASRTRIKTLNEQTRSDNRRFFKDGDAVPHHVITMGLGTILESRTCLLLAFGEAKASAIAKTVEGPLAALVPGSALQMHPDARILVDADAASGLARKDYYKWTHDNKPAWQQV